MKRTIEVLNDLIQVDLEAAGAYRVDIEACDGLEVRSMLAHFLDDHRRHVAELSEQVRALGGEPGPVGDVGSPLTGDRGSNRGEHAAIAGFTKLERRGDVSALLAMCTNEALTHMSYRTALERPGLPDEARAVVERNYADERRHIAWIKGALARLDLAARDRSAA